MIRKEMVAGIGSVLLAFVASQHHMLHMLLIAAGLGGAGAGMMEGFPMVRRLMLLMSALITGFMLLRLAKPGMPRMMRVVNGISVVLTLALIAWSISTFGL